MATSTCDFIDEMLPEVLMDKITLETAGGSYVSYDNPHINEAASYYPEYNELGEITGYSLLPEDIYSASDPSEKVLYITVDASLKEIITDGSDGTVSSWFSNEDFTKYFMVTIYAYTVKKYPCYSSF